jgi:hypothetical protein
VFLVRSYYQPLCGWDTPFRWQFLAEQIVLHQSFHFYPPVLPADYAIYFYPDGIAPLVSILYAWLYMAWGEMVPRLTLLPTFAQYVLVLAACGALAARLGGREAGRYALALALSSTFLLWSVLMAQETGLTALGMVLVYWLLASIRDGHDWRRAALAGIAAAMMALAREYGWVALPLGLAVCWLRGKRSPTVLLAFALAAALLAGPWYLRNGLVTGDPFYPLNPGGFFVANPVYQGILAAYRERLGWGESAPKILRTALYFMGCFSLLPWTLGLIGTVLMVRRKGYLSMGIVAMVALWAYSVGVTNGGVAYSLRVLSPALALLAVAGGIWLARLFRRGDRRETTAGILRTCLATACAVATVAGLTFSKPWWNLPPHAWLRCATTPATQHQDFSFLGLAPGTRLLTDNAYCHADLIRRGIDVVPVWSPEVAFLFDQDGDPDEQCRTLRAAGISHLLLTTGSLNLMFLARHPLFRELALAAATRPDAPFLLFPVPEPAAASPDPDGERR